VSGLPRTIGEQWETYNGLVLPSSAGPVQRQETRRAFYGGAHAALQALLNNVGDDPNEPATEDEEALLAGLISECETFLKAILAGEA